MKKELLTLAIALFCFGCQKQSTKSTRDENANWSDSITHYTEQVRQGNRMAYLRLAECYHQREPHLEQRVIKMASMGVMAELYGLTPSFHTVFESLEDEDSVKMVYNIAKMVEEHQYDKALAKGKKLEGAGFSPKLVEGFIAMKKNQTDEAIEIFDTLDRKGSRMARFFAAILRQDMDAMSVVAKDFPPLYNELARMCIERADSSNTNVLEAEAFYLKAEEQTCLDDGGVQFLLGYYTYVAQKGEREVDPKVIERLKNLVKK
ncbi:MAG: hypothetical protein IJ635_05625 [Bacteroidaceae bacterium]|nr:hypothetical protein [Bacteroidaceae bacterium]